VKSEVAKLLNSPAVAGITIGEHWNTLQPSAPSASDKSPGQCANCDWGYLDDAFAAAKPLPGKTVQLIITPGFDAPQWLKQRLKPCDGLFDKGKVDPYCGSVEFVDFPEQDHVEADANGHYALPLPWSPDYLNAWWAFLQALDQHFKDQPAWVGIAVAGPVAGSDEFILPATANGIDVSKGQSQRPRSAALPPTTRGPSSSRTTTRVRCSRNMRPTPIRSSSMPGRRPSTSTRPSFPG
jgi:hypothetical protein